MAGGSYVMVWMGMLVVEVLLLEVAVAQLKRCGGNCRSNAECKGRLACMSGKCGDDPSVGTKICSRNPRPASSPCHAFSQIIVFDAHSCNQENRSECCKAGVSYLQYKCSPHITRNTTARLTLNSFEENQDGGRHVAQCGNRYYSNQTPVVALSTGWFKKAGCLRKIKISSQNGKSVVAMVVDQCDSINGCDEEHDYRPPCNNNIIDASAAVWSALGLNENNGNPKVTWVWAE